MLSAYLGMLKVQTRFVFLQIGIIDDERLGECALSVLAAFVQPPK
jgi:hypothetical protein